MSLMKINKKLAFLIIFVAFQDYFFTADKQSPVSLEFSLFEEGFQLIGRNFKDFEEDYLRNNPEKYSQILENNKVILNDLNNFDNLRLEKKKLVNVLSKSHEESVSHDEQDKKVLELDKQKKRVHNLDFFVALSENIIKEEMRESFCNVFAQALENNTPLDQISDPIFLYLMRNSDTSFIYNIIQAYLNDYRYSKNEDYEENEDYDHDRFITKIVEQDNLDYLLFLLDFDIDMHLTNEDGETLFDLAAYDNAVQITSYLLEIKEWDVHEQNEDGETPLFFAVDGDACEMISLLLKNGADVNHKDNQGYTPAHEIVSVQAARLLFKAGANIFAKTDDSEYEGTVYNGTTVLRQAVRRGKSEVVSLLLQLGADINERDENGTSLLHQAAMIHSAKVIFVLQRAGLDVNQQNEDGDTPLHNAVMIDEDDIEVSLVTIKALLDVGASMTMPNNNGFTPYELADDQQVKDLFTQAQADRDYRATVSSFLFNRKNVMFPQGNGMTLSEKKDALKASMLQFQLQSQDIDSLQETSALEEID